MFFFIVNETAKYYKERVGLIPCAHGGTSINQWMPGEILYDHAIMMAKLAMRTSTLSGILWHQGEQDAITMDSVRAHKEKFYTMITELRKELGAENLPLMIGEVSAVVSAKDLTLKKDGIHFDSVSLGVFGKRYFEEYKKLR